MLPVYSGHLCVDLSEQANLISTEANFSIQFILVDIISVRILRLLLFTHRYYALIIYKLLTVTSFALVFSTSSRYNKFYWIVL